MNIERSGNDPVVPQATMMKSRLNAVIFVASVLGVLTSGHGRALAQDPSPAPTTAPEGGSGTPPATAPEATVAAETRATPSEDSATDESQVISQVASFAATRLKDGPAVVTVMSGADLRATGARDLVDVLNFVPGFFLGVDTEGVVGPGIRGLWGYEGKILLIIDGKEMNELLFSTTQFGNEFPIELIERVEVIRGPGSVIYGGSAELSVINVVTRSLQGATDATVVATYGQMPDARSVSTGYARRKVTASARYVVDAVPGLSTFASVSLGEGQRSVRNYSNNIDPAAPAPPPPTSATMEGRSGLNPAVVQAGVGYKDLQASFLFHRLGTTIIDGVGAVLLTPAAMSFDSYHAEVVAAYRPTERFELVPRFNLTYQVPWSLTDSPGLLYNKSVRRLRGRLLGRWALLDQLQLTAGGDAIFDYANLLSPMGTYNTLFNGSDHVSYETYGAYVELFSENPIVTVAAGARYDHLSSVGGALVPRLALQRRFGPLGLKGIYSQSFRTPAIENVNANMGIRPERTRIFELEGILDITSQQRISANVYDAAINSPIAFFTDPVTKMDQYTNLGRQGTQGVEVSYRVRVPRLTLEANYSFYRASVADRTPTYSVPGHPDVFLAAPAHKGAARATIRPWSWLGISPSAVVFGERFMRGPDDPMTGETAVSVPAQVLANLFVYSERVGIPGMTVGLGIYNIFGADYRYVHVAASPLAYVDDHASLPGLDREVMLRVSYLYEP